MTKETRVYDPTFLNVVPEALTAAGAFQRAYRILSNESCDTVRIEGGDFNNIPADLRTLKSDMTPADAVSRAFRAHIALIEPSLSLVDISKIAISVTPEEMARITDGFTTKTSAEVDANMGALTSKAVLRAYGPPAAR